ncbi:Mycobacterial persistence regulator A [uncultured Roseburia sp.]|uniref:Stage 0 sporulation protein A homolog n=1 Tax=Brotonthovivens ammoniilytica TaxID=2981725 RepID=A0ABT2TIZ6_9FIRM|nr:response regulator transcription factor [Brotonthovivens ammoniilytica]MCU6762185.1 response regulator transcription factor [Brotonthovivens ammoniilytica]SCI58131.1 Mycobacterial persistence regulator A [uncultured Roseburia sp.]
MRLLLAEDETELADALKVILKNNNYSVDTVYNGLDALAYLESGKNYDGVILDIMMPGLDGISVLKKIRDQGNHVPVLMLTAKAEVDDRVKGLDFGADDYLGKPFAVKELLARIRAVTRRQTDINSTVVAFGNISLNRSTFELMSENGSFRLGNKEFQMLEMLMAHPGQLISTQRFMEKIWGYDSDADLGVVWVYLSYLRKKLLVLKADVAIKAVRNQGYFLEEKK